MMAESNRYFKMEGMRLNFFRVLGIALLLSPSALILDFPPPSMFYVAAVLSGTAIAVVPAIKMTLSAHKMGRVTTLSLPVETFVAFGLWLMVDAALREYMLGDIWRIPTVLISLALVAVSMFVMRQNDASWRTFLIVAPLGVLSALSAVFAKYVLPPSQSMDDIIAFMLCADIWAVLMGACFLALRKDFGTKRDKLCPPGMLKAAIFYSMLGLCGQSVFFTSIQYTPNPAYIVAIIMLSPVWIMLWHKMTGTKDDANPLAGLVMVLAAVLLIIVTNI